VDTNQHRHRLKACNANSSLAVIAGSAVLFAGASCVQQGSAQAAPGASFDPAALVRRASQNELNAQQDTAHPYRYKLRKTDTKATTTKEIVETKDGGVARLILIDDKPLSEQQQRSELDRLNNLLDHPELQAHRQKREKEDSDRGDTMVKMLPNAFLYRYAGEVQAVNGPAIRLLFKPNPAFHPSNPEGNVYHGMVGELWVDKAQERLVRFDAHLVQDVDFGWGVIGRLYKGGSILVEDIDAGDHHWEAKHLHLDLTGRVLLVKTITFRTTEDASDFHPVPRDTTYKDAIHLLESDQDASQLATR
jgi:hypothetical protein